MGEDYSFRVEKHRFPALADGCEECARIETASLLGRDSRNYGTLCLECQVNWGFAGDFRPARFLFYHYMEGDPAIRQNEIEKMQEALRNKGHYQGKVDGVFGLRTRASTRAYQKAENLPITGEVDSRTADGLGVRPESNWGNSDSAGREVGRGSDRAGAELRQGKPSAGIKWVNGTGPTSKKQKEVSRATGPESDRGERYSKQQAQNEKRPE